MRFEARNILRVYGRCGRTAGRRHSTLRLTMRRRSKRASKYWPRRDLTMLRHGSRDGITWGIRLIGIVDWLHFGSCDMCKVLSR